MKKRVPRPKQIDTWNDEIMRNGTKRISARFLLRAFGIQRRSEQSNLRVISWLNAQIPPIYTNDLDFLKSLDDTVFLTHVKLNRIGHFAESEKSLMDRFESEIMPQLKLLNPHRDFRPTGSRDALDFLCEDLQGNAVVVELKKKDGEKRVVEQVLRYIRQIRSDLQYKNPRGVIITGCEDLHTRRALEELEPSYHIDWFIYGIDSADKIHIEPVRISK
jgi:hypothetical protein